MADYKIIADSSCELPAKFINDERFALVPFHMEIDGEHIRDNRGINIPELLSKIAASRDCPKSSCPSPDTFMECMREGNEKRVYIITISGKLSGCYNSAVLAKSLYEEEYDDKEIFVIDSLSASGGESLIALKAMELEEEHLSFEKIQEELISYRDSITTYFVLDNLDTLRKNGRLSRMGALVASTLRIKPLLAGSMGEIITVEKAIGLKKAWSAMVSRIAREAGDAAKKMYARRIIITHCNNQAGAEKIRDMLKATVEFKEYIIMQTSGLSSLYANDGGIIVTY